jgi:tRNA uridine 5-carbamoylmethylation protein Kti12
MFLTTLKIQAHFKNPFVFDEQGSNNNYWWERPLMVVLTYSKEIKQYVLFHKQQAYIKLQTLKLLPSLSL